MTKCKFQSRIFRKRTDEERKKGVKREVIGKRVCVGKSSMTLCEPHWEFYRNLPKRMVIMSLKLREEIKLLKQREEEK